MTNGFVCYDCSGTTTREKTFRLQKRRSECMFVTGSLRHIFFLFVCSSFHRSFVRSLSLFCWSTQCRWISNVSKFYHIDSPLELNCEQAATERHQASNSSSSSSFAWITSRGKWILLLRRELHREWVREMYARMYHVDGKSVPAIEKIDHKRKERKRRHGKMRSWDRYVNQSFLHQPLLSSRYSVSDGYPFVSLTCVPILHRERR